MLTKEKSKFRIPQLGIRWRLKQFNSQRKEQVVLKARRERFLDYKKKYGDLLRVELNGHHNHTKNILIVSIGFPEIEIELGLIKGLQAQGFKPVILIPYEEKLTLDYYDLVGAENVLALADFQEQSDFDAARQIIAGFTSIDDLLSFEVQRVRVGKFAVSSALRKLRSGDLDFSTAEIKEVLAQCLAASIANLKAVQKIFEQAKPDLTMLVDGVYTPEGEIFDNSIANNVDVLLWCIGHKSHTLFFKRYSLENREDSPASFSKESWEFIKKMPWTDEHRAAIQNELYKNYTTGDWFSACGTQFNKRLVTGDALKQRLGLDPMKKTAFIFPHILWDASLFWSKCLFNSYEEWFIETVRAACANDKVDWVIKIHPAHVGKNISEGYEGETAEDITLRKNIGKLPPHIHFIPAHTDINTFSLFEIMDCCLTVTGTVGIEAARLGIPVITAGWGRYSHIGFTIDSDTREDYLKKLAIIQDIIPPLTEKQRELADRFAYGMFLMRPFQLETMTLEYPVEQQKSKAGNSVTNLRVRSKDDWYRARDLKAFTNWLDSRKADYLTIDTEPGL